MNEVVKIFLTAGLTIFGSVIVYVCGQLTSKFLIDPIHEQKRIIAEINHVLIFYANQFYLHKTKNTQADEIVDKFRSLSTELRSKTNLIPFYNWLEIRGFVIPKENIRNASQSLIGLSNSVYTASHQTVSHVESYRESIAKNLRIIISD